MNRRANVLASWLAVLAMLVAVLAPALSHAFAANAGAPYPQADICRAGSAGAAADRLAGGGDAAPAPHDGKLKHCPYCHHGNGMLLLPQAPCPPALAVADAPPTARLPDAPKARFEWTAAQARGPPSL
ncbi:DUF2946 domain-containing protein [Massilia pseudoviolaceinigra]|uniref:DUF2946 domain-containing protein n=1 Tax=Massilia pseudoviolaceinigra TaxID=3057165 RepID=UPI0027969A12|nr:DUF2946 domain-containing protein [Massilia sp. CCM 9206]MDQ1919215.1 DUF2946 domain-containing protein [Massilia sp. CCM 9206]